MTARMTSIRGYAWASHSPIIMCPPLDKHQPFSLFPILPTSVLCTILSNKSFVTSFLLLSQRLPLKNCRYTGTV
jgi:hypothetical protein